MLESLLNFTKARPRLGRILPATVYIGTGVIILLASGPWFIEAAGWRVYFGPALWTIAMLVVAIVFIKKASRLDLVSIQSRTEVGYRLAIKIIGYFFVALIIRQLMIWQFYNPWEKLPLVFLVILQVVLVERTKLDSIGLDGWNNHNIHLAILLGGVEFLFVTVATIVIYTVSYGSEILGGMQVCGSCQLYWISFPYQFLAVGFAEELFFRGFVYTKVRIFFSREHPDRTSFIYALIITNVLFGLFHVPWYVGNWLAGDFSFDVIGCIQRIIVTGLMGVYLTYLYEKTGNLAAPMLVHGFSNSIEPLFTFLTPSDFPSDINALFFAWRYVIITMVMSPILIVIARWIIKHTSKSIDLGQLVIGDKEHKKNQ
jgi:membrane protease YdiL (CAAX protease family)